MPFDMQVKLLRVLQSGEIQRVGGLTPYPWTSASSPRPTRISSRPLRSTSSGRISITDQHLEHPRASAPRARRRYLPLAEHFIHRHELRLNRHPVPLPQETAEAILRYPWPGNIRQLESAVERAVHLAEGGALLPEHFGIADLMENRRPAAPAPAPGDA